MMYGHKRGFTLIELMVAIAIIAILTAIVVSNFSAVRSKSRDAKRVSDIAAIQQGLTNYFLRCGVYPESLTPTTPCPSDSTNTIQLSSFIAKIPTPPTTTGNDSSGYRYGVNGTAGDEYSHTDYILATQLENNNSVLKDSISSTSYIQGGFTGTPIDCSKATFNYCIGPK